MDNDERFHLMIAVRTSGLATTATYNDVHAALQAASRLALDAVVDHYPITEITVVDTASSTTLMRIDQASVAAVRY